MTTKDEALKMALNALEYYELNDLHWDNADKAAIAACRAALAQKDEQALHAGAAVPSEAISLSGDAKLAHDQCRAVVQLASSFAEVYAARAAIVAHDAKLSDLIGDASASAMEWLGDELNAMDGISEDDLWLDPIFEAAQKRWPQQPQRRPQKDEQKPVAWRWRRDSKDGWYFNDGWDSQAAIDAAEMEHGGWEVVRFYSAPPKRKPLTDEQIIRIMQDEINVNYNCWADHIAFCRAIEKAHGIGEEHDAS